MKLHTAFIALFFLITTIPPLHALESVKQGDTTNVCLHKAETFSDKFSTNQYYFIKEKLSLLEKRVAEQSAQIESLSSRLSICENKLNGTQVNEQSKEPSKKNDSPWTWLIFGIMTSVILVVIFIFRHYKHARPSFAYGSSDSSVCPRCGWKHDPSDTFCRNPDCRTQF